MKDSTKLKLKNFLLHPTTLLIFHIIVVQISFIYCVLIVLNNPNFVDNDNFISGVRFGGMFFLMIWFVIDIPFDFYQIGVYCTNKRKGGDVNGGLNEED